MTLKQVQGDASGRGLGQVFGVDELDQEQLPVLLRNKYQSLEDAKAILGEVANISRLFIEFQEHLYQGKVA